MKRMVERDIPLRIRWKRYWKEIFFSILLLVLLLQGLVWLTVVLLTLTIVYKMGINGIAKIRPDILRTTVKGTFLFLFVFIVSIGAKLLVGDIYRIPSSSMEDTLVPGDVIFVDKLAYGPKLPRSPFEISWINLLFYLNGKERKTMHKDWWPYKRLSGSAQMQSGDVIIYQLRRDFFVVKRCMAISGDTLDIDQGKVFINGEEYLEPETVKNIFKLEVNNKRKFYQHLDSLGLQASIYLGGNADNQLRGAFSQSELSLLKKIPGMHSIEMELDTFDLKKGLFAMPTGTQWTLDNMGPIIVPKMGMTITLNDFSYGLYKKALTEHEKVQLERKNGSYYIDGKKMVNYSFKQDYCFVMGDNRKGSMDSRYIGFVPEENIIGKVKGILLSSNKGRTRWDRLLTILPK